MLLLCPLLSRYQTDVRRRGREAEGTRLLNERAPKGHRGFESLRLRQFFHVIWNVWAIISNGGFLPCALLLAAIGLD